MQQVIVDQAGSCNYNAQLLLACTSSFRRGGSPLTLKEKSAELVSVTDTTGLQ
jgi:hypothetical protein